MKFLITFTVEEKCKEAFEQIMVQTKQQLPKVEGCNGVEILKDSSDKIRFVLIESWISSEAHKRHVNNMVQSGGWDNILGMLSCEPESSYFDEFQV